MAIRVTKHTKEFRAAARDFNKRMHDAGSRWGIYLEPEADWLVGQPSEKVWREHYVAVDETGSVHGGFVLKPQEWLIRGETQIVTDWQGPVSEGSVDSRYVLLAMRMMREMTKLYPAVYSWGHGGSDQPMLQMVRKMNWPMHETPFCLLIVKPYRFLRLNRYLRGKKLQRFILDVMAVSGVGYVAVRTIQLFNRLRPHKHFSARAQTFDQFEEWADDLWDTCKDKYDAIALRDSASMNRLAPEGNWPPVTRLRIEKDGTTIGWALVLNTKMSSDARFGDLHVGSVVDCLADPDHSGEVVWACTQFLKEKGVDIVVSNQAHPKWVQGFSANGYLLLPRRRLFVMSPALRQMLEPFDETAKGLHLTNMDGHGPHSL